MARPRKNPPKNAEERIRRHARLVTSKRALAAKLGVSLEVFNRWLEERPDLAVALEEAWADRSAPIIQRLVTDAEAGDRHARNDYFRHVDPTARRHEIEKATAGRSQHLTVNGDVQVSVLPNPNTKAIDDYLAENNLLPGSQREEPIDADWTPIDERPVIERGGER